MCIVLPITRPVRNDIKRNVFVEEFVDLSPRVPLAINVAGGGGSGASMKYVSAMVLGEVKNQSISFRVETLEQILT